MEERTILYCDSLEECEEELRQSAWERIQERVKEQRAILDQKREEIRQQSNAQFEATMQQQLLELRQMSHQLMIAEQESLVMVEQEMRDKMDEYCHHSENSQKRYNETMEVIQQANVRSQERKRCRSMKCTEIKQEATKLLDVLDNIMKSCKHPQLLEEATSKMAERGKQLLAKVVTELDHMIHNQSATNENITEYRQMVSTVASYLGDIKVAMEMANKKGDEQLKLKQQREKEEQLKIAEKKAKEEAKKVAIAADIAATCSPVGRYNNAITEIANLQKKLEPLKSKDPEVKKLRLKLLSSVNHPVNAIAPHTKQHLLDKVQRLKKLLEGKVVTTADRAVSTKEHPLALDYCTKELADKLVRQGDTQVSAKPEAAFAVAAVAIAMAASFPRVRDLIVAHFYSSCPILVPFYIPKTDDVSEDDHKRMQGYRAVAGTLESEESYYKRISGIIRLYAAIVQYPVPKDMPHPHGPEHGWAWLANILNTEPRSGITATALLHFLEVAGYRLMECYGRQFVKLLRLLGNIYMPMIEKVTATDQKGSFVRLQLFLEKVTKTGSIPKPPGYITVDLTRT